MLSGVLVVIESVSSAIMFHSISTQPIFWTRGSKLANIAPPPILFE